MTFDTKKYWFSDADKQAAAASSDPRNNPAIGIQQGVRNYFTAVQQQAQQQEMKLGMQKFALQAQEYFSKKELQNQELAGNAALASVIATNHRNGFTPDTPEFQTGIWEVAERYPSVMSSQAWSGVTRLGPAAEEAKAKLEYWREQMQLRGRQVGLQEKLAEDAGWVPAAGEIPGHFLDAKGGMRFPPRALADGSSFQPKEVMVGTTKMVQVSPNKFQVVDRALPPGKITDIEREQLRDLRSQLAAQLSSFGEQKDIDALKTRIDSIYTKVQGREAPAKPATPAEPLPLNTKLKEPISKEEYDKLPAGATYTAPDGTTRTKQ